MSHPTAPMPVFPGLRSLVSVVRRFVVSISCREERDDRALWWNQGRRDVIEEVGPGLASVVLADEERTTVACIRQSLG